MTKNRGTDMGHPKPVYRLNHFNWGNPTVNFDAANFGLIQTQAGSPRVLQFGIKFGF